MTPGARTPEELDALLEDAFVLRDPGALASLFEARATTEPRRLPDAVHLHRRGFENLVREMSVPAERRTLPPTLDEEPGWEHVAAVAKANGCGLLT